jgi:hypothetical protein
LQKFSDTHIVERNESFLIQAHTWSHSPELQIAEIWVHFSRQRIEVNSESSKRTSDKGFEILRQFATEKQKDYLTALLERVQYDYEVGQKTQESFFLLNVCGFCREKNKNLRIPGFGHLVQEVQLFLDKGLLIKGQSFSPNRRSGLEENILRLQNFCHLVQPVTKDLKVL